MKIFQPPMLRVFLNLSRFVQTRRSAGSGRVGLALALTLAFLGFGDAQLARGAGVNSDEEIVYIDPAGVIRVFDVIQTSDNVPVQWVSPTGGWDHLALGDMTGDGAKEIVAIGHTEEGGKLAIFDPVYVGSNPVPGQEFNGIPWVTYFQTVFATRPSFVATGRFEGGDNLAQIVISRPLTDAERTDPNHHHRLQIWRASGNPPNPTAWTVIATFDSPYTWDWIATGDFTGNGLDEIALIDRTRGHLGIFRLGVNRTLERLYANESDIRAWQTAAFGQYSISNSKELVAVRHSSALHNLWVFRWVNNQVSDFLSRFHMPPPDYHFLADIGGNGDVEIVALRAVPPESGDRPHLFVIDNGNDPIALREARLDRDNGFVAGAGADLNGDRRAAFVLIRNDRIRIYFEPYRNRDYVDYPLPTNSRTVVAGNLDAAGQRPIPQLDVSPRSVSLSVVQGRQDERAELQVLGLGSAERLEFTVTTEAAAAWLTAGPAIGQTPGLVTVQVDARALSPGSYTGNIRVASQSFGLQQIVDVPVTLTVAPGIRINPDRVRFSYEPCDDTARPQNFTFRVEGAAGVPFETELFPEVAWMSIAPSSGVTPANVTVTVLPGERSSHERIEATLEARATNNTAATFRPEATIEVACREVQLYLPSTRRVAR